MIWVIGWKHVIPVLQNAANALLPIHNFLDTLFLFPDPPYAGCKRKVQVYFREGYLSDTLFEAVSTLICVDTKESHRALSGRGNQLDPG